MLYCSGNYDGSEPERLACLKLAAIKGAPYIDVEFKAAAIFFAGMLTQIGIFSTQSCNQCVKGMSKFTLLL